MNRLLGKSTLTLLAAVFILSSCTAGSPKNTEVIQLDLLIENGQLYNGEDAPPKVLDVGIKGDRIVFVGDAGKAGVKADRSIDAADKIVSPGFIDPHTHVLNELKSSTQNGNIIYLAQGVTTIFGGNDGFGAPNVQEQFEQMKANGIGTNLALFAGHGTIRAMVMGRDNRAPTAVELEKMKSLVAQAMREGALGFSTGLYYVPGTYSNTDEVVALAKIASAAGGVYDSHIRDESTYTIGVIAAIEEALEIGRRANIPVNIAHIKALGVDVWGKSVEIIAKIEEAQKQGLKVTADQYPWLASGIKMHRAIMPGWALEGSDADIMQRFKNPELSPKVKAGMAENIRRRGGAKSFVIAQSPDASLLGKTLAQIADNWGVSPVDASIRIFSMGMNADFTRVASFNMNPEDLERFMVKPWVMTSSDGQTGHPRLHASYPQKYRDYVANKKLISAEAFIHRSSGLVADTFGIKDRGYIKPGLYADVVVIDPKRFAPKADFKQWKALSEGVDFSVVNGQLVIDQGEYLGNFPGRTLKRGE